MAHFESPAASRRQTLHNRLGWGSVLSTYADRWSLVMMIFTVISRVMTLGLRVTGRLDAEINKAGGKMLA